MAGQIIPRGPGKFLVRVYLGTDASGKRQYHSKTIHGNKKDAQAYLTKVLRERDLGEFIEPSRITLSEYLDEWLKIAVKPRVEEKTYNDYSDRLRLYIKPPLGGFKLAKISPEQIQIIYNGMIERGLSPRTVRYTHSILRNALQQAVKWGKMNRNPADLVDLPKQKRAEMKVLSPGEAVRFMAVIVYSRFKAFFSLLLSSGMRPGEALGLKWPDIDFEGKRVTVNRSLTDIRGRGWALKEPKTDRSRRTIPLPALVIEDLLEHKTIQAAEKLKAKPGEYNDQGFIFAAKNGEPMIENNIAKRYFKPLLKDAGLPDIRLYDLRHTCATLLLAAGVNPKVVSERLGHASITLTLDTYSHVLPDMQAAAVEKLEKILF